MVRGRALFLLLLVLPFSLPAASASSAVGVGAEGPDAQGAFRLLFDVQRDAPASVDVSLDVRREDADGPVQGARELGPSAFPAGTTRLNLSFLPAAVVGYAFDTRCGTPGDSGGCEMSAATIAISALPIGFLGAFLASLILGLRARRRA